MLRREKQKKKQEGGKGKKVINPHYPEVVEKGRGGKFFHIQTGREHKGNVGNAIKGSQKIVIEGS